MKHLVVPYGIAVILKEKGYNENCLFYYTGDRLLAPFKQNNRLQRKNDVIARTRCTAPLYQQVTDWFREEHGIIISVTNKFNHQPKEWIGVVSRMDDYYMEETTKVVPTYYKALTEAIEVAIKLV